MRADPRLVVKTGVTVLRLVIEGNRATGVHYAEGGQTHTAHASAEVIVTAGAFGTPKLLMLSGIAQAADFETLRPGFEGDLVRALQSGLDFGNGGLRLGQEALGFSDRIVHRPAAGQLKSGKQSQTA